MRRVVLVVCLVAGCFTKPEQVIGTGIDSGTGDGATDGGLDSSPDAGCQLSGWSGKTALPAVINSPTSDESEAALSPDGTMLVFVSNRNGNNDLFLSRFDGTSYSTAEPLTAINTTGAPEGHPAWGPFSDRIYFTQNGASKSSIVTSLEPLVLMAPESSDVSSEMPRRPRFTTNGLQIVFFRQGGNDEMWTSRRSSLAAGWQTSIQVPVNTASNDTAPVLTSDGLTLYFSSDRNGGSYEIYEARRTSLMDDAFVLQPGTVAAFGGANQPEISRDGKRMYLTDYVNGKADLFVATRQCL